MVQGLTPGWPCPRQASTHCTIALVPQLVILNLSELSVSPRKWFLPANLFWFVQELGLLHIDIFSVPTVIARADEGGGQRERGEEVPRESSLAAPA